MLNRDLEQQIREERGMVQLLAGPRSRQIVQEPCAAKTTGPAPSKRQFEVPFAEAFRAAVMQKFQQHLSPIGPHGRPQSQFGGELAGPMELFTMIGELIEGSSAVPGSGGGLRVTGAMGKIIGLNAANRGFPTQYLTVILQPTGAFRKGLPVMRIRSVYPGCPR
jgi:hypothetical protein